ncbi:MAG: RES family NAD+ phosphorylase [Neomegalonema sp.]|nr:RES family NAD+ phosphorylase [Neomegalonema sp.]
MSLPDDLDINAVPLQPYSETVWRIVEAQTVVSTTKLTQAPAEQALLEEILEESKPSVPPDCTHLHYLQFTPFRYGCYPKGSRFRQAGVTPGVFYAAEHLETAAAEFAFGHVLFYAESPDTPVPKNGSPLTAFSSRIAASAAADLRTPPLDDHAALWNHKTDYTHTQALEAALRARGCDALITRSVRDPAARSNVAVLECSAFDEPAPIAERPMQILISENHVSILTLARTEASKVQFDFDLEAFDDPRLTDWLQEHRTARR